VSRVGWAIEELHRAENDLRGELLQVSDRNKADHEIFHIARDVAQWSARHVAELAKVGEDYGVRLDPEAAGGMPIVGAARRKGSELLGRRHAPALLLLKDLRTIHRKAAGVSLDWEVLAQTAQALQDSELLALCQDCHPETLRQLKWANAKLKETAAQAMVVA